MSRNSHTVIYINAQGDLLEAFVVGPENRDKHKPGEVVFVGGWTNRSMLVTAMYTRNDIALDKKNGETLYAPPQIWLVVEELGYG